MRMIGSQFLRSAPARLTDDGRTAGKMVKNGRGGGRKAAPAAMVRVPALRKLRRAVKPWYQLARLKNLLGGPYLPRLECHVTDHCNLNCAGCSHFSNLSPEVYKDAGEFERELSCLSQKLQIGTLRLLGGEPLLHPGLPELLRIARTHFPHSRIEVCTNCTLLERAGDAFWEAMKTYEIQIAFSFYPPMRDKYGRFQELAAEKGVPVSSIHRADEFWATKTPKGDQDPERAYWYCYESLCRQLRNGRLYICPDACYMDYYNRYFGKDIPVDAGIDIYTHSGRELVHYLSRCKETCRYCTERTVRPWAQSEKRADEWDA